AEKGKITGDERDAIIARIVAAGDLNDFSQCAVIIEAVIEDLKIKQELFKELEGIVDSKCLLATNTSSLSITSIAGALKNPSRFLGLHFFNPAPLLPLVEIVPGLKTDCDLISECRKLMDKWGKVPVVAKDTPGFIVNRIARPFYGEALRIYEEGIAEPATIDWALKEVGGFRMGPFELMDLIGIDVNFKVTETVFEAFFYDPRFKPSFVQKRMVEAGLLGRKTGSGFYDYSENARKPEPCRDKELGQEIFFRVLAMLINEASDAVFLKIATPRDIELAMTRGVNYPKGLLAWADEIGLDVVLRYLEGLQQEYGEDRYRPNPLLRRLVRENKKFVDLMD
ncbi:MAG: 3-hydroxybutyryl-CoA dehydrogenase, partial [Candidatus Dadabacteria bacterium]